MTFIQDQHDYYDSVYHLIQLSVYKLNNASQPLSLERQLLIRNLMYLSSNLIAATVEPTEDVWLDACFNELIDEEEDYEMEEEEEKKDLVVIYPITNTTLFLHVK